MYDLSGELTVILITIWWLQKFGRERFNLKKLSEVRKLYQIKISKEVCSFGECINRAWENIKDNIKTSATEGLGLYELKQHQL